jgi:hypothetical protein
MFYVVCGEGIIGVTAFFSEEGEKLNINNFRVKFQ